MIVTRIDSCLSSTIFWALTVEYREDKVEGIQLS